MYCDVVLRHRTESPLAGGSPASLTETPMHTIAANAYIAYRSVRDRIRDTAWPFELDPLCALVMRFVWLNGGSYVSEGIRTEFGLPRSTLSSALGRLERRGHIRRHQNVVDRRYVDVTLTRAGNTTAPLVADLIDALERDVRQATSIEEPRGFDRVTTILAVIAEEGDES
jgi:DNA-binding MarR family transcriptional regulator